MDYNKVLLTISELWQRQRLRQSPFAAVEQVNQFILTIGTFINTWKEILYVLESHHYRQFQLNLICHQDGKSLLSLVSWPTKQEKHFTVTDSHMETAVAQGSL